MPLRMPHKLTRFIFGAAAISGLTACGDPLSNVPTLNDVQVQSATARAAEAPSASAAGQDRGGLIGRLLNRATDDPTNAAVEAALADLEAVGSGEEAAQTPDERAELIPAAAPALDAPRRGLGGLFRRGGERDAPRTGPDATDVAPGTVMPFGAIARVCDVPRERLGTLVDSGGGFQIYDTIPNSTASRPFHITGFGDGCARTFTGAVIVTGDVETHEFVRYQPSNEGISFTTADNAYEALKANVCRVGRGTPCGARAAQLNRNTVFITVYDFFGGTFNAVPTKWAQILLHDGEALAMSLKDG